MVDNSTLAQVTSMRECPYGIVEFLSDDGDKFLLKIQETILETPKLRL